MSNKIICIIDDDPIYQFLINKIIGVSKIGYDVMSFSNGKEAMDYFTLNHHKNLPEIIMLDLEMPIMDGWDFLNEIETINTENTALFIVSSSISHEDKESAKAFTKIKGYYSKPITTDKILQIANHLKQ